MAPAVGQRVVVPGRRYFADAATPQLPLSMSVLRINTVNGEATLEAVPVTPGRTLGDALEIAGGALKAGDKLVLSPGEKLAAGARVTVAGK